VRTHTHAHTQHGQTDRHSQVERHWEIDAFLGLRTQKNTIINSSEVVPMKRTVNSEVSAVCRHEKRHFSNFSRQYHHSSYGE